MAKILVDADALIALAKTDDDNHPKALKTGRLYRDNEICLTPYTLPEVVTVLSHKVSQSAARKYLLESESRNWQILETTPEIISRTNHFFIAQSKKGTSWVDCLNCIMVKHYHLNGIFSFDKFYSRQKIKMIK